MTSILELSDYPTNYDKVKELGRGRFGIVYEVTQVTNGETFAAKHIRYLYVVLRRFSCLKHLNLLI